MKIQNGIFLIIIGILSSCTEIYFTEPQPKGIKIAENGLEELAGEYISSEDTDTLKISKEGIIWSEDDKEEEALGDLIIKKYKGYYFVNLYSTEKGLWQLFAVNNDDPDHLYVTNLTSMDEDRVEELADKKYSTLINEADSLEITYFVLSPSKRQLIKLLKDPIFDQNRIDLKGYNQN